MAGVRAILNKYDVRPSKRLGQNFLVQDGYLNAIARAANLTKDDIALEIGAGVGNLTKALAGHAGKVVAIEFDRGMLGVLHGELKLDNVEILEADALKTDYLEICPGRKMIAVANLPYNVATEIIFRLFDARERFSRMILMTQLEVARRFVAKVGSRNYGILAVLTGLWAQSKVEFVVPAGAFYPRPKVDSAVVRFEMRPQPAAEVNSPELFSKIVHAAFSQRRKMIANSITSGFTPHMEKDSVIEWLEKAGIDPKTRAQNLTVEDFAKLERIYEIITKSQEPSASA